MEQEYYGIEIESFEDDSPRMVRIFKIRGDIKTYIEGAKNEDSASVPDLNRYSYIYSSSNGKGWSCLIAVYSAFAGSQFFVSGIPFVYDIEGLHVWNEKLQIA